MNPWDFSCSVTLTTGADLVLIKAADVAGNVAMTKLHLAYGTLGAPASLSPSMVRLERRFGDMIRRVTPSSGAQG